MKTILSALAIAAASSALAAVTSSNTFGILRVDSTAAQTIVSVPWLASGGGNINVADVIKTANLNNGDKLYYYNTGTTTYRVWELTDGSWREAVPAGESATVSPTLARGNAIILERFAPQGGSIAPCFYLYGQYTDTNPSVECVANGYTLLAPTGLNRDCDLNDPNCCSFEGVNENDMIYIPNANGVYSIYEYDNGKWGMWKKNFVVGATIPVGSGAWYVSKGGSPTITWKNPAAAVAQ